MKSNGLLKWFMIPLVLLAVFVGIKTLSGSKDRSSTPATSNAAGNALTPAEMKALGVEGDTPRDTLATLVAQLKQLRQELQTAVADNKQQKSENERLRQRETSVDQRIQSALDTERERSEQGRTKATTELQQTQSVVQELQHRIDDLKTTGSHPDLPVGLGLEDTDAETLDGRLQWAEPLDTVSKNGKANFRQPPPSRGNRDGRTSFEAPVEPTQESEEAAGESSEDAGRTLANSTSLKPVYTVPSNATLMGSIAMTALIGRVPIDGTVNDPYPFKVLIGPDNLTANGIDLPDVAGAVVSGTASGDWTLSCVRGQIRSITFVFEDGTIRTVPSSSGAREAGSATQGGLGWISDPHGIPCVSGERRSNAQQYLTSQMLITAAGAGAASLIKSDRETTSVVTGTNGNVLGTVGISGTEAVGRVLAGGVQDMSQWVNKLYGQAFAAIYVKPGAQVAVHIEQPIDIDYDTHGRKVDHRRGETHAPALD